VYSPDAGHEIVLIEKPWIFWPWAELILIRSSRDRTFAAITTDGVRCGHAGLRSSTLRLHDTNDSDGRTDQFSCHRGVTSHGFR